MGNKKSFYHHLSNKRINNETVRQLLNRSGDLLTMDADKALDLSDLAGPLNPRCSRRRESTSTGRGLNQGFLKKSQLIELPGRPDGIFKKMPRDCLMTMAEWLQGHSLILLKLWRLEEVLNN